MVMNHIEAMGAIRRVGKHGNGYIAKLVNDMLWKVHAAAVGEAMVAAKLAGLEPDFWWEVMKGGAADSYVLHHDVSAVFAGHYDSSFPIALCCATTYDLPKNDIHSVRIWTKNQRHMK